MSDEKLTDIERELINGLRLFLTELREENDELRRELVELRADLQWHIAKQEGLP